MDQSDTQAEHLPGSCLCGAVRFRTTGPALFVAHCQCVDCRKTSGTGHSTDAGFRTADVVIDGPLSGYRQQSESGNQILRSFCSHCGTKIGTSNSAYPDEIALNLAAFDDPEALTPDTVYFTRSAVSWDLIDPSLKAYETQP